jgi:hypothetical protein
VIVAAAVRTAAHADDPLWVWHLVVALAQGGCHFVCEGAGHDHDVGLARRGAEDDAQAVLVVAWHGDVHHFDAAAGEGECEGPEGALSAPIDELIELGPGRWWLVGVDMWSWTFGGDIRDVSQCFCFLMVN